MSVCHQFDTIDIGLLLRFLKGQDQFNRLVSEAKSENWKVLPIGEQTATAGEALACKRYKRFTLKIDK